MRAGLRSPAPERLKEMSSLPCCEGFWCRTCALHEPGEVATGILQGQRKGLRKRAVRFQKELVRSVFCVLF